MPDCCSPKGYRWMFGERTARFDARRYRRRGLDATSRRIVEFVKSHGIEGRTVLEVGGGIGAIQIELLKAGAAGAVSVELVPTYEEPARELLAEAGLAGLVERKVLDFTQADGAVESADVVILNRVICCYHDMPGLTGAAADHTRQLLVLSYPKRTWWTRAGLAVSNALFWLTRREFHVFLHPPDAVLANSERHGLRPVLDRKGLLWTVAALSRFPA